MYNKVNFKHRQLRCVRQREQCDNIYELMNMGEMGVVSYWLSNGAILDEILGCL